MVCVSFLHISCGNHKTLQMRTSIYMGLDTRNPVFWVFDQVGFKPAYSATETSWNIEILPDLSLDIILCMERITKALIRLHIQ